MRHKLRGALLVTLVAASLAGCGDAPTEPRTSTPAPAATPTRIAQTPTPVPTPAPGSLAGEWTGTFVEVSARFPVRVVWAFTTDHYYGYQTEQGVRWSEVTGTLLGGRAIRITPLYADQSIGHMEGWASDTEIEVRGHYFNDPRDISLHLTRSR